MAEASRGLETALLLIVGVAIGVCLGVLYVRTSQAESANKSYQTEFDTFVKQMTKVNEDAQKAGTAYGAAKNSLQELYRDAKTLKELAGCPLPEHAQRMRALQREATRQAARVGAGKTN